MCRQKETGMTEAVMPVFYNQPFLCDPLHPSRFPGKPDRLGQGELVVGDIVAYVVHALQTAAVPAVVGEARRIEHGMVNPQLSTYVPSSVMSPAVLPAR